MAVTSVPAGGVMRRWVLPIIRLLVFAAIAAALVKLAFFGGLTAATDQTVPTGSVQQPTVAVATGTVRSDVHIAATITADPAVPVRASAAGTIVKVLVTTGQTVAAGASVATVRVQPDSTDGGVTIPPARTVTVTTTAAGTVSDVPVLAGQDLAIGDVLAQVAPASLSVVGTMPAEQQYRLLNRPTEGAVTVTGGPQPFTCTNVTITTPLAGAGDASSASQATGSSDSGTGTATTTVRCAVPAGVTVFSGLAAKLTLSGGVAASALTVPITAVEGAPGGAGVVWTVADGGTPTRHDVTLGVTDGKVVEVTGGLAKGDEVLEFVPSGSDGSGGSGSGSDGTVSSQG